MKLWEMWKWDKVSSNNQEPSMKKYVQKMKWNTDWNKEAVIEIKRIFGINIEENF